MSGPPEITELRVAGLTYIVRAEPTGLLASPLPIFSLLALTFTAMRRLLTRDHSWTISVRRSQEDPFGPLLHQEVVPTREAAAARLTELVAIAASGHAPWVVR